MTTAITTSSSYSAITAVTKILIIIMTTTLALSVEVLILNK